MNYLCNFQRFYTGNNIRYDVEILCAPETGVPVFVTSKYKTDGTPPTREATFADGTAYTGTLEDLVACGGSVEGAASYGYVLLCDPETGGPVILQTSYDAVGATLTTQAFLPTGVEYSGNIALLVACAGGGSEVGNQTSWQSGVCDPTTNQPVLVEVRYQPDGTPLTVAAYYYDLTPYTGEIINLVACTGAGSDPGEETLTWNPLPTANTQIANPGVGLQTSEKSTLDSTFTNNQNYPFRNELKRFNWFDLDVGGTYDFTNVILALDEARAAHQIINLRIYDSAADSGTNYGCPEYAYLNGGWQVQYDSAGDNIGPLKIAYWGETSVGVKANIVAYQAFLVALAAAIGNHPAFGSLDVGWGSYSENNYSGYEYIGGTKTGVLTPTPTVGAPPPDLTVGQIQDFYNIHRNAFPDKILITPAADDNSFNYAVGALNMGARMDGFGYRNNPGGCPGGGSQMCTDALATFISPGTYPDAWQVGPNIEETYGWLYSAPNPAQDWIVQNWGYQQSFNWLWQQAHTSEINLKGRYTFPSVGLNSIRTAFEGALLKLGYRFQLKSFTRPVEAPANATVTFQTAWENLGCAPNYRDHVIAFKLSDQITGLVYTEETTTTTNNWAPGTTTSVSSTITIPSWFPACAATIAVALVKPATTLPVPMIIPDIQLANDGDDGKFWYVFPSTMVVTNPSPTVAPDIIFAAGFTRASSMALTSTDDRLKLNGTSFTISCVIPALDTSPGGSTLLSQGFVTKGNRGAAASLEYWLGYSGTVDRIRFLLSDGSVIYTVNADSFGPISTLPPTSFPLRIVATLDNVAHTASLYVNNSVGDTISSVGTIIATPQTFRIGADATDGYAEAQITEVGVWKTRVISAIERAQIMGSTYRSRQRMQWELTYGLFYRWEMSEATGAPRIDCQSGLALTSVNAVAKVNIATTG